nr:unnamed protein product [Digitaria exilis]
MMREALTSLGRLFLKLQRHSQSAGFTLAQHASLGLDRHASTAVRSTPHTVKPLAAGANATATISSATSNAAFLLIPAAISRL